MIRNSTQHLVIIGNGMAGARVAEEILNRDPTQYSITMVGVEPGGNYNRILLSNVLNGTQTPDQITLNALDWYERNGIELITSQAAIGLNRTKRQVMLMNGRTLDYDKVIIATGSRPFVPPVPGVELHGVFVFRTLDDCRAIEKWARKSTNAVVIGGGLLGLEAARGLLTHGPKVQVVEIANHLMAVQLDSSAGAILGKTLAAMGVTAHCGQTVAALHGTAQRAVSAVEFKGGRRLECDMVVISAGIRPNKEIAADAALKTERGIMVNDHMQTSDPDIYAVGECCQHNGQVYGLVAPIWEQCQVLADHITARNPHAAYRGSVTGTKLKVMGVNVAGMGERDGLPSDEIVRYEEPAGGVYKKVIIRDGKLVGATLLGDTDNFSDLMAMLQSGAALPRRRTDLLFGPAPGAATGCSMADMPDEKQICDCNGISKGQICKAIKAGKTTVPAVGKATRAGTGCGSCKKMIRELIEEIAGSVKADPSESWYVPAIPMDKPTLRTAVIERGLKSVSSVMEAFASKDDEKSRMGLAILLRAVWHKEYIDERDCRFVNDRVHGNIQKDGTFSVIPRIYGGVTTADELVKIGLVAKKYNVPTVKLTGGQRIDLLGVKKELLPDIWRDLGMVSGYAYTKAFRTCKTCVGSDWCRFGTNDSTALGIAIEKRLQGLETPAKVKMGVSGCPRNCAEATVKDVGIIATEGGEWEILVGGAAGVSVRKADSLCRVSSQEQAIRITERFLQYYQEHARYLERTYDFVPRIGIQKLRALLVDDSEGLCAGLDERVGAGIEAALDPWEDDSRNPKYAGQFAPIRRIALPVLAPAGSTG